MRKLTDILREEAKEDPRDLRSRSDDRKVRIDSETYLSELGKRLVALSKKQFERLTVSPELGEAVAAARKITSAIALDRQMRIVRRQLRGLDAASIALAVEDIEAGRAVPGTVAPPEPVAPTGEWLGRLRDGGDAQIQQFIDAFPAADRQQLRQLVRAVQGAVGARKLVAEKKLEEILRGVITPSGT